MAQVWAASDNEGMVHDRFPAPTSPAPWIAPNLDLYVRFHRDTTPHEWLFDRGRAELAEGGLIAATGAAWSPDRKLVASGATQLDCRPRPERFK